MTKPKSVNSEHFSTESFPNIIGFCERDDKSHIQMQKLESYQYKLGDKTIYLVKKIEQRWEILRIDNNTIVRVSVGNQLGVVLFHALVFAPSYNTYKNNQDIFTNILIPIHKADREKTTSIMYYLGGYSGGFMEISPELALIKEKFIDPDLDFLVYSYVPVDYIPWLREELTEAKIIGLGKNMTLWVFKK